jgi:hypothetical protein
MPGAIIDAAVAELLLATLTPLALEVALSVSDELIQRAQHADSLRATSIQRAQHAADQARRRYLAVDPGNRLVADALEADWNARLRELADAQDHYTAAKTAAAALDEQQRARIRALAADLPALWNDPATPARERKRLPVDVQVGQLPPGGLRVGGDGVGDAGLRRVGGVMPTAGTSPVSRSRRTCRLYPSNSTERDLRPCRMSPSSTLIRRSLATPRRSAGAGPVKSTSWSRTWQATATAATAAASPNWPVVNASTWSSRPSTQASA